MSIVAKKALLQYAWKTSDCLEKRYQINVFNIFITLLYNL